MIIHHPPRPHLWPCWSRPGPYVQAAGVQDHNPIHPKDGSAQGALMPAKTREVHHEA